ncbi:unnamed protein product [Durusdinium trenchii]|uniref:PPPDE domain-containing protein n=2 Tax=Durusdinium trenchii TaxID=1381693 RepID=A0ABP0QQC6_9DINO
MGTAESVVSVPVMFGGPSPVKLAATVLFHLPSAAKMRGAEPFDAFHTSIVLGDVEYAFSGQGIRATRPYVSHSMLKRQTEVRMMGHTNFSAHQMVQFLTQFFQPGTYDLLCKNCNSFSDCALYLLLGQRLEAKYSRMERTGKVGQKRIGLMSALRLIGMNYQANPASQNFQVDEVLAKTDLCMRGRGVRPAQHYRLVEIEDAPRCCLACC